MHAGTDKPIPEAAFRLTRRDLRLGTGLVLFAYVALHLLNHALGLVSLAAAEAGLRIALKLWHSLPGTFLLYGAAAVHFALAMLAIYERRTLRMSALQALRIWLGLGIPLLLIGHIAATRLGYELHGLRPDYARIIWNLWSSDNEGRQLALLVPGWVHGCLGLHFAFGTRAWYAHARLPLFGAALVLPVVAGLGFLAMGRELAALGADRVWLDANVMQLDAAQRIAIGRLRDGLLAAYFVTIGLVVAARELRGFIERRRNVLVEIAYPQRVVQVPRGWSVLEASRGHDIAHVSVCGGRARCSTCRVRVVEGVDDLPPPGADEQRTLERIGAPGDVRLACQLRPSADISVVPLVDAQAGPRPEPAARTAADRDVALLFIDLHGWKGVAHSAHDTIYAINLYLEAIGAAIANAGGRQGPFAGDQLLAIFGLGSTPAEARAKAFAAAADIGTRLRVLDERLQREFGFAADIGLRLHAGPAVIGEVGPRPARALTALGDTVHAAHRLYEFARAEGARLVVSEALLSGDEFEARVLQWKVLDIDGAHLRVAYASAPDALGTSPDANRSR